MYMRNVIVSLLKVDIFLDYAFKSTEMQRMLQLSHLRKGGTDLGKISRSCVTSVSVMCNSLMRGETSHF